MKKCIILSENAYNAAAEFRTLFRNIGAMEVARRFRNNNYETTHLEWFNSWTHDELAHAISLWFSPDDEEQVLAISVTFSLHIIYTLTPLLDQLKKEYPKLKIIVGGNRSNDPRLQEFVDYVFVGRSMEVLEAWIADQDLGDYSTSNPGVLLNRNVKFTHDVPVIPEIEDGDVLNSTDILAFEIGIGCKFNCSFCSFDLRGVKEPLLSESERIRRFLQEAYDKYGITHFYVADDTMNEQDTKLEILADAIEALTYKPNLTGYLRIDLLEQRPQQYELLRRCGFRCFNLGIETLHPDAAKMIRKSTKTDKIFTALEKLKTYSPNTFITTGMIIGLTGDNEEHIERSIKKLVNQDLVHSISPYTLGIQEPLDDIHDEHYMSEIGKAPEKFGYTITDRVYDNARPGGGVTLKWKNDWCDSESADEVRAKIQKYLDDNRFPSNSGFEWLILLALGIVSDRSDFKVPGIKFVWQKVESKIKKHKQQYIKRKLEYLEDR